jgi:hypothetical protein
LYSATVMAYKRERIVLVLRAIRMHPTDAAQMARVEAIARGGGVR